MGLRAFEGFLGLGGSRQDNVRQNSQHGAAPLYLRHPGVTGGALLN